MEMHSLIRLIPREVDETVSKKEYYYACVQDVGRLGTLTVHVYMLNQLLYSLCIILSPILWVTAVCNN